MASLAALALVAASGCSQESAGGGAGGNTLTVLCGAQEDWCQAMTKEFAQTSGIQTNFVRLSSGEAVARLGASKGAPEFDVWHGGPSDGYEAGRSQDLLEPHRSPATDKIPAEYKSRDGYWTGVYLGVLGFCSNTDVLTKIGVPAPQSWADLTRPELRKQISSAHPATSGTAYTTLWTQMELHQRDEAATFDYMRQLNQNILQYSKSGTAPGQQAGRGEIATGLVFTHDCVKYKKEGMSALQVTVPAEGTGYEVGGVAVVKNGANPEAAKKYLDFAVSAPAQNLAPTVGSYQVPTAPDANTTEDMIKLSEVKLIDYDAVAAGEAKAELVKKFDSLVATAPRG